MKCSLHIKEKATLLWFVAAVLCFTVQWYVFRSAVFSDHPSILGTSFKGIAEGALIMAWYWLLPARFRWCLQIQLWLCGLLLFANVLYFRVFNNLISMSDMVMFDNFNPLFFRSSLALFKWSDTILLAAPLCLTLSYIFFFRKLNKIQLSKSTRIVAIASCIVLWCAQQVIYLYNNKHNPFVTASLERGEDGLTWQDAFIYQFCRNNFNNRASDLHARGFTNFTLREIYRSLFVGNTPITLTDGQKEQIAQFLSSQPKYNPLLATFEARDSMNVVMIIVESLNPAVIGMEINGKEVTPNLNHLTSIPTTIFIDDVICETRDGGSSDGQLIYDTGLLPLSRGAASMSFSTQIYPSLASTLSRNRSTLFIADDRKVWNYESSSKQYGYDRLYDETDLRNAGLDPITHGKDKALFALAADVLTNEPEPFFAEIITLSMHLPFHEEPVERFDAFDNSGHSTTFNDYITAVHFFDQQLGTFIERLKQAGIFHRTLLFLASDHYIIVQDPGHETIFDKQIAFIAINAAPNTLGDGGEVYQSDIFPTILDIAGKTNGNHNGGGEVYQSDIFPTILDISGKTNGNHNGGGEVYQSDIFPTILDIAGKTNAQWRGLGTSIFCSDRPDSIRRSHATEISDLIIRGSYFSH